MIIRKEIPSDLPAIDRIHLEAFRSPSCRHPTEHLIVRELRAAGALTLSLVAEWEGEVAGHLAFSPALINGQPQGWFTLGPVAVLPSHQHRGIGSALILAGLQDLRALQAQGCLLVGDPLFYRRFGFRSLPSLELPGVPPETFMGLPFGEDLPSGVVSHHPAFFTTA